MVTINAPGNSASQNALIGASQSINFISLINSYIFSEAFVVKGKPLLLNSFFSPLYKSVFAEMTIKSSFGISSNLSLYSFTAL